MPLVQWLTVPYLEAQSLPEGWWQHGSSEDILTKAEVITHDLSYLHGSEAHLLSDPNTSLEFFQRQTTNGLIETKTVTSVNGEKFVSYKLENGDYFFAESHLIKHNEQGNSQKEIALAEKFDHPYDYKFLKSESVGINDCIVIARIATTQFLQAMRTNFYPGITSKNFGRLGDPIKFIKSETDTYIRKSDGVVVGEVKKNNSGEILDDRLLDVVQVDVPIPNSEFELPAIHVAVATNIGQFMQVFGESRRANTPQHLQQAKQSHLILTGIIIISLGTLLILAYFVFHRGTRS